MNKAIVDHKDINSFLHEFLHSSNSLTITLKNYLQTKDRILLNMISFSDAFVGDGNIEIALENADRFPFESKDPNIAIIYYCLWSLISMKSKRIREAKFLMDLAKAKEKEEIHIETLTYLKQMEAEMYFGFDQLKATLLHCIEITPNSSPSQKKLRLHYALTLAKQGIAKSYIDKLINDKEFDQKDSILYQAFQFIRFLDHTEAGRFNAAMELLPEVDLHHESLVDKAYFDMSLYNSQRILLNIYHVVLFSSQKENLSLTLTPASFLSKTEDHAYYPTWILIIECLLDNKKHDALVWARTNEEGQNHLTQSHDFTSFNLIRAELASANIENAKRILHKRHEKGNHHYLDNFFQARISLLEENMEDAYCCFSKLMEDVELNESWGRLDLELRLAKELSPLKILKTGMNLSKNQSADIKKIPEPNPGSTLSVKKGINRILGDSLITKQIKDKIITYAKLDLPVLITGETGTGKEVVARALYEESTRNKSPFIIVNCAAISDTILESELFGHQKGAFTGATHNRKGLFEEANNGTIFLDEIGDISQRLQVALLRVLENGEIRPVGSNKTIQVNCRAIAATNAPLDQLSESGSFRKDLLFRLQRLNFWLPPLRERKFDIIQLTESFIYSVKRSTPKLSFSNDFIAAMEEYPWPGNIRELKNEIELMALMNPGKVNFRLNDLDLKIRVYLEKITKNKTWENPNFYNSEIQEQGKQDSSSVKTKTIPKPEPIMKNVNMDDLINQSNSPLRRIQKLKILFEKHTDLTRKEICQYLNVSPQTTSKDLKHLIEKKFITKIEPSAAPRTHYFSKI